MPRPLSTSVLSLVLALPLTIAAHARADDVVAACLTSHETAQREVRAGHWLLARDVFARCAVDQCPPRVRAECVAGVESVNANLPTVVLAVLDADGSDVTEVRVFSGDDLLAERLSGRAIPLDPGKYRLRFLLPWGEVLSTDVLIREGEKSRRIEVRVNRSLAGGGAKGTSPEVPSTDGKALGSAASTTQSAPSAPAGGAPKLSAWTIPLGVTSLVGLGLFVGAGLAGLDKKSTLDKCKPECPPNSSDERAMRTLYTVADVGLGVGLVAGAVTTYLLLNRSLSGERRVAVSPWTSGTEGGLSVAGHF